MSDDYLSTLGTKEEEETNIEEDVVEPEVVEEENGGDDDGFQPAEMLDEDGFQPGESSITDDEKIRIMREQMGDEYVIDDNKPEKRTHFTQEEIRNLTDTKNLFQSPLFRFSFGEVLNKASVNWKKCTKIEDGLRGLKEIFDSISSYKVKNLREIYPSKFIQISDKVQKLQCNAPQNIAIVGSYLLRTIAKPYKNIDISLVMPKNYITSKDYGKTYFEKRAYYLCAIAENLKSNELFESLEIVPFRGDLWKPIISINFKVGKNAFKIRIIPSIENTIFGKHLKPEGIVEYHRIVEDQYYQKHLELLHKEMKDCPVLVETAILLRVWARNRNIYQSDDSLNGFLLSMLANYLLSIRKINKTMSSFQMIKLMMNWIVKSDDVMSKGLSLSGKPVDPVFTKSFDLVLLDTDGDFNIFSRVTKNAWRELQSEAKNTLAYMKDEKSTQGVELLFLTKHNFWYKFDAIVSVKIPSSFKNDGEKSTCQLISNTLVKALDERVKYLRIVESNDDGTIFVGLIFKKKWFEPLTVGPSPLNKEKSEEFKSFWGKRSITKDFNGVLHVCTEWTIKENECSVKLIENICNYILQKHLDKNIQCNVSASDVYSLLKTNKKESEEINEKVTHAFNRLEEVILETDINLVVDNISVVSPEFYNVSINSPNSNTPILTVLQFRSNARWPDNVEALEKLKQLIYLRYSESLQFKTIPTRRWIDIVCEGFTFRVVIFVSKEINIIKRSGQALNPNVHELDKTLTILPLHYKYSGIFKSIHKEYSETVRIAKSWVNTHFMSDYLEDAVVELMCMHVFTDPNSPYRPPRTAICGFFRFLNLICTHSWFDTPLLVNTSAGDDQETIQKEFTKCLDVYEQLDDKPSMYIVAAYNMDYVWTRKNPPAIIVHRMIQFAMNTEIELFEYLQSSGSSSELPSLFVSTDMESYDLIIHLKKDIDRKLPTGFNPYDCLYRDLKQRFSRFGLIFKDTNNTMITMAINPEILQAATKQSSISNTYCMKPSSTSTSTSASSSNNNKNNNKNDKNDNKKKSLLTLELNIPQIMFEINKMGEGIISSVEINQESPLAPFATDIQPLPTQNKAVPTTATATTIVVGKDEKTTHDKKNTNISSTNNNNKRKKTSEDITIDDGPSTKKSKQTMKKKQQKK